MGVLPLCKDHKKAVSHSGLSFGEIVWAEPMPLWQKVLFWKQLLQFLAAQGIESLYLKPLPDYQKGTLDHSNEFILGRLNAKIVMQEFSMVLNAPQLSTRKKRSLQKAQKAGLWWRRENSFTDFWDLLSLNLNTRHQTQPTHQLSEIQWLASVLPEHIQLACAYQNSELLAGAVLYLNQNCLHIQYMANSDKGRQLGALDWLLTELQRHHPNIQSFSLGVSTIRAQNCVNEGLHIWKEEFGAKLALHQHYEVQVQQLHLLDSIWCKKKKI